MRIAVERRAWVAPTSLVGEALAFLVAAAVFFGNGSSDSSLVWIGGAAIAVAAASLVAFSMRSLSVPALTPLGWTVLAFLAGLTLWEGLSVLWSIEADRSWDYFNRSLVYLAFFVLGLIAGLLPRSPRFAAGALTAICTGAILVALATKVFPSLSAQTERVARLNSPIGYWNALALLVDFAIPLALWIAAPRTRPDWLRGLGVTLLYLAGVALLLTLSRGGLAVGIAAAAIWIVIGRPRLESAAALVIAFVPMLAVAGWAFSKSGLTKDLQPRSLQVHDGRWFGLLLALGAAFAFGVAFLVSRYERRRPLTDPWRMRLGRAAVGLVIAAAVVGTVSLLAVGITPSKVLHKFNEPVAGSTGQSPEHLTTLASSSRWSWWQEAWHSWEHHALAGTGAGSFELVHRQLRNVGTFATEPHNLPLQFLVEGGIVGFVLFLGIAFAGAPALVETLRRLEGEDRLAAAALVVGLCAYVIHGVVDFDWDFAAVTVPAVAGFGVLVAAGRPALARSPVRRTFVSVTAGAIAAAALFSLLAPWLASQKVDDAYAAIGDGNLDAAISDAKSAHSLNPVAIDPLLAWAAAEQASGHSAAAGRVYTKAISIQPDNWRPWYYRAKFLDAIDGPRSALFDATQAAKRDPLGPAGSYVQQLQGEAATSP
jgi:hypothetical protein